MDLFLFCVSNLSVKNADNSRFYFLKVFSQYLDENQNDSHKSNIAKINIKNILQHHFDEDEEKHRDQVEEFKGPKPNMEEIEIIMETMSYVLHDIADAEFEDEYQEMNEKIYVLRRFDMPACTSHAVNLFLASALQHCWLW